MQQTKFSPQLNGYIVGQIFFQSSKTIGRGTFGKVKLGIHKLTNQPVAIKFLEKQKIKDISDVERVSRELHFLKIVRHPAIAQMYEIIQTTKMIYIIMEYAAGGEYFDYVMDQKIKDQAEAFHYFSQVLYALIYLHKLKICHRDIKPQNMLLDSHKRIKIVDFGLSNMYKNTEKLSTACGSPCYASPEMIKGEDYDPELTDVWSLGIVLYTSVLSKLPFEDENTNILYGKIKSGLYRIDKKISPELKDLLSKMINIKPQCRLRLKQLFDHPWYRKFDSLKQISGIQIGYENIPIDRKIVSQMQSLGFECKKTIKYLENNVKNQCTATYYLFLKQNFKTGNPSVMDICAQNFQKSAITPVFSLRPKRYNSCDESRLLQSQMLQNQSSSNFRKCHSLIKHEEQDIPRKKKYKFLSLKKHSFGGDTRESFKFLYKNKLQSFLKTRASMEVRDKLHERPVIKNKSLSVSTEKVRKSLKNLQVGVSPKINKIRVKTLNDQQKFQTKNKSDFISEIYCPRKKVSVDKRMAEPVKYQAQRTQFDNQIGGLFWRKKSSVSKPSQGVFGQYSKISKRNTFMKG